MPIDRTQQTDEELYQTFNQMALSVARGGDSQAIYMKCNTMRVVWKELRRRGLPDPRWPEELEAEALKHLINETPFPSPFRGEA